jgi:hypothetical protein
MPRNPRVSTRGKISQAEVYVLVLLDTWIDSLLDDSEEVSLVYEHSWLLDHTRRKYCYWWICCFLMCCGFCLWKNWPNTNEWWQKLILESLSYYLPSCEGILPQQTGLKSHHLYRDHRNQEKENHEWTVWLQFSWPKSGGSRFQHNQELFASIYGFHSILGLMIGEKLWFTA